MKGWQPLCWLGTVPYFGRGRMVGELLCAVCGQPVGTNPVCYECHWRQLIPGYGPEFGAAYAAYAAYRRRWGWETRQHLLWYAVRHGYFREQLENSGTGRRRRQVTRVT